MADTAPIRLRARLHEGYGELRLLLIHPMESGLRKDAQGHPIPPHFITRLSVSLNGREVIRAELGPGLSANPLFAFELEGVHAGDGVEARWEDNLGQSASGTARFA